MPVINAIQIRKGPSSDWSNSNPVLASGEPGYDTTNKILKIGDGVNSWVDLNNHYHSASNISDFNTSVSGLLPVTNITSGNNISVTQSGTVYNVAVTGSLGLTTEEVDDRVAALLVAGSGINLNYNDNANSLTISVTKSSILSDTVGSTNYIGYAPTGSSTSNSVWTIKKTVYTSGGAVSSSTTATNVKWDDRLTATYS